MSARSTKSCKSTITLQEHLHFSIAKISGTSGTSAWQCFCWIATDDGLYTGEAGTMRIIKVWNTDNGLPNNVVYAVVPDDYSTFG